MNLDQAYQILDYGVPKDRAGYFAVIGIVRYTKINGVVRLSDAPDRQLQRVAERLFREAGSKVDAELNAQVREIQDEEDLAHYHAFLCDRFNIPSEDRDQYAISQLEEQLMQ